VKSEVHQRLLRLQGLKREEVRKLKMISEVSIFCSAGQKHGD
jgi:hypothetical protein